VSQVSVCVQALPSLQVVPWERFAVVHVPLDVSHAAFWQVLDGALHGVQSEGPQP
jgi:hypothetical protein